MPQRIQSRRNTWCICANITNRADFAYASILLIQLHRIWNIWRYRDLTGGDTSAYFDQALLWFKHFQTDVVWSPLYTIFYGTILHVRSDPAAATVLHRVLIVLAAAALVLAVARQMLPKPLAWFVALWWVMLPVDFDPMYEVHLFALLPILLAWWVIGGKPSVIRRGLALGLLLAQTLLVRNEFAISFGCLGLIVIVYEARKTRSLIRGVWRPAYVVPSIITVSAFAFVLVRTPFGFEKIREEMRIKHTLNMAQVYAFGYQQRHPEWSADPWTEYDLLTTRDFGVPEPTFGQMLRSNPRATLEHIGWNFRLLPAGLQVMLFDATSSSVNPDYAPVMEGAKFALALSILLLLIGVIGAALWARDLAFWRRAWNCRRRWSWLAMGSVVIVMPLIIATQRPRAEYLYPLSVFLMIVSTFCGFVIVSRWARLRRLLKWLPLALVVPALCVPSEYQAGHPRPLLIQYQMMRSLQPMLLRPSTTVLCDYGFEIEHYLGENRSRFFDPSILELMKPDQSLAEFFQQRGINLIVLAPRDQRTIQLKLPGKLSAFEAQAPASGWKLIQSHVTAAGVWRVYAK